MNNLRNTLKREYSQIPNELITDTSLSNGALRVLLYLFTKPDNWQVYNKDIEKRLCISDKTLSKYWKELINGRWLRRDRRRDENGHLTGGYDYHIGNFTISEESSVTEESSEHSNNKPINKQNYKRNSKNLLDGIETTSKGMDILKDFIEYRKAIKHPIKTQQPLKALLKTIRLIDSKGGNVSKAIQIMKEKEWRTLNYEWVRVELNIHEA